MDHLLLSVTFYILNLENDHTKVKLRIYFIKCFSLEYNKMLDSRIARCFQQTHSRMGILQVSEDKGW